MRIALRSVAVVAVIAAVAFACGGSADTSDFVDPNALDEAGNPNPPPGIFNPVDAGKSDGNAGCKKQTCATAKANCGPIGDGCGNVIQCGTCSNNETCGGGGVASTCGKPPCTKKTCAQLGVNCGTQGDGCGGTIASCGTCDAGICGGGGPSKCGGGGAGDGGACVPTKTTCAAGDCGPIADGCGGLIDCSPPAWPACPAGQSCGGGGTPSLCGAPPCVKKTCGALNCGFIADGCGGIVNCWPPAPAPSVCAPGEQCGGAGMPNTCGIPAGCTGLCLQQQTCPGAGTTSIEGYVTSPNGVLPVPNAVVYVPNGVVAPFPTTGVACETCATASGSPLITTTTDANGHFILPNMPVSTPGKVVDIPLVVQLGRWRKQLTIQTTACVNTLVPAYGAGAVDKTAALPTKKSEGDIPLTAISTGNVDGLECVFRKMGVDDSEFTNGAAANIAATSNGLVLPQATINVAFTTGFPASGQILVATSTGLQTVTYTGTTGTKFTGCTGGTGTMATGGAITTTGRIRIYQDNGATISASSPKADTLYCPLGTAGTGTNGGGCATSCPAGGPCAVNEIDKYDAAIFGCVGSRVNKGTNALGNIKAYANKGGRVFATHFSYVWLNTATTWTATATTWAPGTQGWNSTAAPGSLSSFVDTSFPKGVLFSTWLQAPVAPVSATYAPPYSPLNALYASSPPRLAITEPRKDINPTANFSTSGIVAPAQRWIYATDDNNVPCVTGATCKSGVCTASKCVGSVVFAADDGSGCNTGADCASGFCNGAGTCGDPAAQDAPLHYTFNTPTPAPAPPATQCGRVVFSDFHVSIGTTGGKIFPAECNNNALTSQEKVLAYFLFDLASCVSTSGPPACVKKTCLDQGLGCGLAGDGCGGPLDCGPCPPGQTCGGAGVPSQCGAPACTPKTCTVGQCGKLGNGCGGTLDCGVCAMGTCGGGGANLCGVAACVPQSCPAPAAGSVCGPVANGCGAVNNCPCPAGVPCVNGLCGAPACTPRTCAQAGANCGSIADGCGGIQMCGNCIAPQTCGGGGTPNLCGGGVN